MAPLFKNKSQHLYNNQHSCINMDNSGRYTTTDAIIIIYSNCRHYSLLCFLSINGYYPEPIISDGLLLVCLAVFLVFIYFVTVVSFLAMETPRTVPMGSSIFVLGELKTAIVVAFLFVGLYMFVC